MTDRATEHWTCPHGLVTGFFPVPGQPHLIEHRSCGICCDEISASIAQPDGETERFRMALYQIINFDTSGGKQGEFAKIASAALGHGECADKEKAK